MGVITVRRHLVDEDVEVKKGGAFGGGSHARDGRSWDLRAWDGRGPGTARLSPYLPHYHSHQGTHSAALFAPWCLVDAQFISVQRMNEDVIAKPRSTASCAMFYRPQYPIRDKKGCLAALT